MEKELQKLTEMAADIQELQEELHEKRQARNKLALRLIERGQYSLRTVADYAGVQNPYLVQLRKKKKK